MEELKELKIKFNKTFELLKEIDECETISNIIFNFEKLSCEFENLSNEATDVDTFEKIVHSAFDELNTWKENISLSQNMQFHIEKTSENICNNVISILHVLSNTDNNCRIKEITFNYSINIQDNLLGVLVYADNISYNIMNFPMAKEITKELILKEIVDTFYNYINGIKIETWQ